MDRRGAPLAQSFAPRLMRMRGARSSMDAVLAPPIDVARRPANAPPAAQAKGSGDSTPSFDAALDRALDEPGSEPAPQTPSQSRSASDGVESSSDTPRDATSTECAIAAQSIDVALAAATPELVAGASPIDAPPPSAAAGALATIVAAQSQHGLDAARPDAISAAAPAGAKPPPPTGAAPDPAGAPPDAVPTPAGQPPRQNENCSSNACQSDS